MGLASLQASEPGKQRPAALIEGSSEPGRSWPPPLPLFFPFFSLFISFK
jgi:hypothetical protein